MASIRSIPVLRVALALLVMVLLAAGCGGGGTRQGQAGGDTAGEGSEQTAPDGAGGTAGDGETQQVRVLIPAESPIEYPHRVAEALGYFAEEGIATTYEYAGGSSEVIQQIVAGNGDIGVTCASAIVGALEQGFTDIRPVFTTVYGSLFGVAVPDESELQDPAELRGKTVGISDPAGGEVAVVRGILREAGIAEGEVNLLPIGEGTAVSLRAIEQGQVDAIGGSLSDFVALEVQGLELRMLGGEAIADLPACGVIVMADYLESNRDLVEGFLRASAKGVLFGQENPDAMLQILREASPDAYEGETGERLVELYVPLMAPPNEDEVGEISVDSYERYVEFTGADEPQEPLDEVIVEDLIGPANDFDREAVAADAEGYAG